MKKDIAIWLFAGGPMPDSAQLKKVYEEEYYSTEKPDYFKHYEEDGGVVESQLR